MHILRGVFEGHVGEGLAFKTFGAILTKLQFQMHIMIRLLEASL